MNLEPTIEADFVSDEPFALASGEVLTAVKQRYAIYGAINDEKSNVVLVFHALTGSARVAEWWTDLIGAGQALDTNRNAFVCVNYLGSCYGSTGANSVNPESGDIYGTQFPLVTARDIVQAQAKVLEHLGIKKLRAVVGGSLGGQLALQTAIDFPDLAEKCVAVGACALSAMGLALNHLQRQALRHEKNVNLARQIAMISYKSKELFDARFARQPNRNGENPAARFDDRFDIAGYLDYQGAKFVERFDAETFKIISKAMDLFDLTDAEIRGARAKVYLIGISSDWLYPAADVRALAARFLAQGVAAEFIEMFSPDGHDAFLSDTAKMGEILKGILNAEGATGVGKIYRG